MLRRVEERSRDTAPGRDLDEKQRVAQGEKLEARWDAVVAKDLAEVRTRAAAISPEIEARRLRERDRGRDRGRGR